ncbi:ESPR-type extended signal peptide-containing protein [Moraxella bovoculi]|uniref:ESPR-type extended signal peptide-containing protein n=1 Tax=Moraxella bovoculi TaxID=386891 RepID=UPI000624CAA6|nr:ESPR-type extended signal peptide-containing protein [Moraxella bovoculi]AKG11923.1 hypothetical protein AAX07_07970 [Moraxella bovoculi]
MNSIYKIVFNKATGTYQAVAEFARSHTRVGGSSVSGGVGHILRAKFFVLLPLTTAVLSINHAYAAISIGETDKTKDDVSRVVAVKAGKGNIVTSETKKPEVIRHHYPYDYQTPNHTKGKIGGNYSDNPVEPIAVGNHIDTRTTEDGIASGIGIGDYIKATGGLSISLGHHSSSLKTGAVALGTTSKAAGFNSLAISRQSHAQEDFSMSIGTASHAGAKYATAIGQSAQATGEGAIALGSADMKSFLGNDHRRKRNQTTTFNGVTNTQAKGKNSVAIGRSAQSHGEAAFAGGLKAKAYTNNSLAIGTDAEAGQQEQAAKVNAIALGHLAKARGQNSVVIGSNSNTNFDNTYVLGSNVTNTHANSVFLGASSAYTKKNGSTAGDEQVPEAQINGITYGGNGTKFAGHTPWGVVSVGAPDVAGAGKTKHRRIQNVGAGLISAGSTDAINGSQLYQIINNGGWTLKANNTPVQSNNGLAKWGDSVNFVGDNGIAVTGKQDGTKGKKVIIKGTSITKDDLPDNGGYKLTINKPDGQTEVLTIKNGSTPAPVDQLPLSFEADEDNGRDHGQKKVERKPGQNLKIQGGNHGAAGIVTNVNDSSDGIEIAVKLNEDGPLEVDDKGIDLKIDDNTLAVDNDTNVLGGDKKLKVKVMENGGIEVGNGGLSLNVDDQTIQVFGGKVSAKTTDLKPNEQTGKINTPTNGEGDALVTAKTVADAINNSGFTVQANGKDGKLVKAGDKVNFIDGNFTNVTLETGEDGQNNVKVNVNAQGVVEKAQLPVVYTDAEGNKLTLKDGKFIDKDGKAVDPADVIASINNGKGSTTEPTNLANVAGSLTPTYNTGDMIVGPNHKLTDNPIMDATKGQEAPQGQDLANMYNNAATVGDILNAGWNLQGNGEEVDFVKAYDTLNFVNGTGTTAVAKASEDGKTSTVQYDVNVDDETITTKQDPRDSAKTVITAKTAQLKTNPQGGNEAGKVTVEEGNKNALITAGDVANAINNAGFTLKANNEAGKLIKAGDTISINEGDNIEVTHDKDGNIKISGKKDVDLTTAVFTDKGGNKTGIGGSGVFIVPNGVNPETQPNDIVTLTVNGLNNGGNSITNVKANLVDNDIATEVPAQNRKDSLAGKVNNAATVGDVLNAGWNLQNNGQPVDVVSHADTVNFVNGRGTTVVTDNDPATGTTTIKVDSPIAYVGGNEADATDTATPSNTVKLYGKDNSPVQVTNIASGVRGKVTPTGNNGNQTAKDVANAIKTATGDTLNNAVNVGDLKATINDTITTVSTDAYGLKDKAGKEFKQNLGSTVQITGDDNINTEVVEVEAADGKKGHALKVSLNPTLEIGAKDGKDGKDGVDGKLGINGKDGSAIVLNGKDGSIGLNGKDGKDGLTFKAADGAQGVDGEDGENGLPSKNGQTRIVYETKDKDGNTNSEQVANLNDGLIFTGNDGKLNRHKLNSVVKIVGEGVNATESGRFESATGNINVKADGADKLEIQLSKDIDLTQGGSITIGDTVLTDSGLTIIDGPSVTKDGINAGDKKITNVADGEDDADVVNVKQLKGARTTVTSSDNSISVVDLNNGQDGKNLAYNIEVNSQAVVENAQLPVVYTDVYGNRLYKQPDGTFIDKDGKKVDPADVIASINNGKGSTTEPTNLANVAGSLTPTYNTGDMIVGPNGRLTTNPMLDATKEQAAPQGQQLANIYNNAATVGDVLNSGFNLQANGKAADFVKAYDTVNFVDGQGTKAVIETSEDGKTNGVRYDVVQSELSVDPQKGTVTAGHTGDAFATAKTVADAINNSGFTLKANNEAGKLIKAGDTISINEGDNIEVTQDESGNITVATKQDVAFETVKVGDTLQVDNLLKVGDVNITPEGINAGNQKVTNVQDGNISEGSKDAVNGGQIHQLKADLTKGINAAKTEVKGEGFAKVTPKVGSNGQTIYTVNVAKASAAKVDASGKLNIQDADGNKVLSAADTINAINNSGFTLKANGEDGKLVKAGDVVSINQGNNTRVFQDENGNITVETKDDVAFETVKVGDVLKVGNITINPDGISAAGTKVTNVADGTNNQDAVNVSQLNKAKAAATTKVEAGNNVSIDSTKGAQGQDIYTINAKDRSAKVIAKAQGLIAVETGDTTDIDGAQTTSYTVDLTDKAKGDIAKGVEALDKVDSQGLTFKADKGSIDARKLGDTLNVKGDKNITTEAKDDTVEVKLSDDITVDSVTADNSKLDGNGLTINAATPANTVSLTAQGLNNGGQRITNVAPGVKDTDAVNVSQLKGMTQNIYNDINYVNNRIGQVDREAKAGIASAMAFEEAPFVPGKWTYAVGAAHYGGEQAVAATLRKTADNGRWAFSGGISTASEGDTGFRIGVSGVID